ncbi:MAG: radical SAM protein [Ruminococcus sp.]|nr:radical SAM protein [Ruminococcus sp.]
MNAHFIKKTEDSYVMFIGNTMRFYNVNENVKNAVIDIQNGLQKEYILDKYTMTDKIYDNIFQTINASDVVGLQPSSDNSLSKLAINVTNKCNLQCKYCYAGGGSYCSDEGLMDIATAKKVIDVFYNKFKSINAIHFFGGEPLLNEPIIRFICEYITELYNDKKINTMPQFGATTNGTIYSDQLVETMKRFNIFLTISIDGPKEIHDNMRIGKGGKGSFDIIIKNIEKFRSNSININASEITFNNSHLKYDYSVFDTIKYLKDNLDIQNIHIVPVSGNSETDYRLPDSNSFSSSVKTIFEEINRNKKDYSYSMINRVIQSLRNRTTSRFFCGAGLTDYSVSIKGDIYPCFMFTDIESYKLGNVWSEKSFFESPEYSTWRNKFLSFNKYECGECAECFNNRICSGCLGTNYFNTGNIFKPSKMYCDMQKALTENVLLELSEYIK